MDVQQIYSEVISELIDRKPEIAPVLKQTPKLLDYSLPREVVGAVPDYEYYPWLSRVYGYEMPPILLNPRYAGMRNYDLMAAVYHEAVHQAQMDGKSIENLLDRYISFEDVKHRTIFYGLRSLLMANPLFRSVMMEGEAQYLTRRAFPHATKYIMPYENEEKLYRGLIEHTRRLASSNNKAGGIHYRAFAS